MTRLRKLITFRNLELTRSFLKNELSLMEQGTPLGFFLSFLNNVIMLLVFQALFVKQFLVGVPNTWLYLLIGIVQWNLYINISMAGFGCFIYRQKLVMGFNFPRELLILARSGAVFVPYLIEFFIIICISKYMGIPFRWKYLLLPVLFFSQYMFCAGLCCLFAFIGVLHKNIIPFWNIMFRLLSFATPIFYLPVHFQSPWANLIYTLNPFTVFMIWARDIIGANGVILSIHPFLIFAGSFLLFSFGYLLFRITEPKVGDCL